MLACRDEVISATTGRRRLGPTSASSVTRSSSASCCSAVKPSYHSPNSSVYSTSHTPAIIS